MGMGMLVVSGGTREGRRVDEPGCITWVLHSDLNVMCSVLEGDTLR